MEFIRTNKHHTKTILVAKFGAQLAHSAYEMLGLVVLFVETFVVVAVMPRRH